MICDECGLEVPQDKNAGIYIHCEDPDRGTMTFLFCMICWPLIMNNSMAQRISKMSALDIRAAKELFKKLEARHDDQF